MDLKQLIEAIKTRSTATRWGIGLASHYVKAVEGCLYGDLFTVDDWRKAVKDADGRLTYCDELMGNTADVTKSIQDGSGLPDGFCMTFDCTLTSKRLDRDGDILDPMGLKVDEQMPLLWQHLPMQPIGKHLDLISQNDDRIRVKFGIVDTPLGRDAATLTKTGCLRMSQGFKPLDFEPVESTDTKDGPVKGWHVTKGEIREGSLVSIPSNVDGIVEAYCDGGFSTPLVKSWAKSYHDARPVQVPVNIDLSVKVNGQSLNAKALDVKDAVAVANPDDEPTDDEPANHAPSSAGDPGGLADQAKSTEPAPAGGADGENLELKLTGEESYIPGSFEWASGQLRKSAANYVRASGQTVSSESWTDMVATFRKDAVVCVHEYGSDDYPCYRMKWQLTDGEPAWTGDVTEVKVQPSVVKKMAADHVAISPGIQIQRQTKGICGAVTQMDPGQAIMALEVAQREMGAAADLMRVHQADNLWN
jgi:hypothetical protein